MNFKKVLAIFCLAIVISPSVYAGSTKFGLGTILSSRGATLYFPINSRSFIIEPTLYLNSSKVKPDSTAAYVETLNETISLGIGLFNKKNLNPSSILYFGARFSYNMSKYNYSGLTYTDSYSTTGFTIAPTLGVEYFMSDNFSFGIELDVSYSKDRTTGKFNGSTTSGYNSKNTYISTSSVAILRYHFN